MIGRVNYILRLIALLFKIMEMNYDKMNLKAGVSNNKILLPHAKHLIRRAYSYEQR